MRHRLHHGALWSQQEGGHLQTTRRRQPADLRHGIYRDIQTLLKRGKGLFTPDLVRAICEWDFKMGCIVYELFFHVS